MSFLCKKKKRNRQEMKDKEMLTVKENVRLTQ